MSLTDSERERHPMKTKSPGHSGYELQLQLVEVAPSIRLPDSRAMFLGDPCEFSLSDAGQSRSALNQLAVERQGTADYSLRTSLDIKVRFRSQIIVDQHNPNKRVRS
jgi:hypothetical protein